MAKFHPDKEVSDVMEYAVDRGWTVVYGSGHCYATLRCPRGDRTGCQVRVHSTPQNPGNHARKLLGLVNGCQHTQMETEE